VLGARFDAFRVKGTVLVKLPGTAMTAVARSAASSAKGVGFVPLTSPRQIPIGSELDTTHGVVRLTMATATSGVVQTGEFEAGIFKVLQRRQQRGLTELDIIHSPTRVRCARLGKGANIARAHLSARVLGLLKAVVHGHFTTRGEYSAATVRGTIYSVTDRCDGTFTRVVRGRVRIEDFVLRKAVTLLAGQSYLARALVVTGEASAITQTTAQLIGSVTPNGSEVTGCAFEYGPSPSYGHLAVCTPAPGQGFGPVVVSSALSGLTPNSTIHFRTVATNQAGTAEGADNSFHTPPFPPAVFTSSAAQITSSGATLAGTVELNGAPATRCQFEYGPTSAYGSTVLCTGSPATRGPVVVTAAIGGLAPRATVHFRLTAANSGGSTSGADKTVQTHLPPPTIALREATAATTKAVTLNAIVNANGAELTGCEFEFGPTTAYGEAAPCSPTPSEGSGPVPVSARITGLQPNQTLHFRLFIADSEGLVETTDATARTLPQPLLVSTGLPTGVTRTSATLNGDIASFGAEITHCEFQYGATEAYGGSAPCSLSAGGEGRVAATASVAGLSPTSTYHFRLVAANRSGTTTGVDSTINTPPNPLTLTDTFLEHTTGGPITLTASTHEPAVAGLAVRFTVSGANPQTAVVRTNQAGEASFEYVGTKAGEDHIAASIISAGKKFAAALTATWLAPLPAAPPELAEPRTARTPRRPFPAPMVGVSPSKEERISRRLFGRFAIAAPVSGVVLVTTPGGHTRRLRRRRQLLIGSLIDARRGALRLFVETPHGAVQSEEIAGGLFRVHQGSRTLGVADLEIVDPRPSASCTAGAQTRLGGLNLAGRGAFSVRGRFSVTTLHGAAVSVQDRCNATITVTTRGEVRVHDLVRATTVLLHGGQRYIATPQ
jgi:hypothetical protein